MDDETPFGVGSWKGRVLKAIAIDGAKTWREIRDMTGLSPKSLNRVLAELHSAKALKNPTKTTYRVPYDLYKEYEQYFSKMGAGSEDESVEITEDHQKQLIRWISDWKDVKDMSFELGAGQFFLSGQPLSDFTHGILGKAKSEIIVVNPF